MERWRDREGDRQGNMKGRKRVIEWKIESETD
jgi:hypothetical protein